MPTSWTPVTGAVTPWTPFAGVSALWDVLEDYFPPILDGGRAATVLWPVTFDGGSASVIGSIIMLGTGPQRTSWTPRGAP